MNRLNVRLIYLSLIVLFMPAYLSIVFPELSGDSRLEVRELQNYPKAPDNWKTAYDWPRKFDQFASDRFPFRSDLIRLASRTACIFGISISPEVIIGENGWLFLRKNSNVLDEHRGIIHLSNNELNNWVEVFSERKKEIEKSGAKLFFVIIPNKHTIYNHNLPPHFSAVRESLADQIVEALKANQVDQVIDLRPTLQMNGSQSPVYDKYDTHWNDEGVYIGYREIMDRIDPSHNIPRLTLDDISFREVLRTGDLARLMGNVSLMEATVEAEVISSAIIQRQNYERRRNYTAQEWSSTSKHQSAPVALCFCDSFVNSRLYKYLEQSFSKTIFKHHRSMRYDKRLIEKYSPDIVMYVVAERLIPYKLK